MVATFLVESFLTTCVLSHSESYCNGESPDRHPAAELLRRLAEDNALVHDDVTQNDIIDSDEDDASTESDSPLLDSYLESGGSEAVVTLTNFTLTEFHFLWAHVDPELTCHWDTGRGRRSTTTPKDAFMMLLCVLKHYGTWQKHAMDFGYKAPTFEKMMYQVLEIVAPVLDKALIRLSTMASQRANSSTFRHYPYALYATDVKFQPAYRPAGRFNEARHYFSNKHKLYGYKVEASVAFPGRVVFLTNHTPGSVSDITIMANHVTEHERLLKKTSQELLIDDNGEGSEQFQGAWAILADKGYQGAATMLRVVHPKKKSRNGELDAEEHARNARVSSDRVLVENFFGRVCLLWKIMHSTFKWNESSFDMFTRTCFVLTNFHAEINPLRLDDGRFYRSVMGRYASIAERERTRRASIQRRYRRRRDARISADRNIRTRLSHSPSFSPSSSY